MQQIQRYWRLLGATLKPSKRHKPKIAVSDDEAALYTRIRDLVLAAGQTMARVVDLIQVQTNFEIGRHIF